MTTSQQITGREYLRVSKKKGQSCDEQHADNIRSAETHRIVISAAPYIDDGISASKYGRKKRGDFVRLVKDLKTGAFTDDVLIIWESSRGSRKVSEWASLIELCEEQGKLIHVTSHGRTYDPRNGRDVRTLQEDAVDSQYESYKVHTRTARNAASNAADGRPTGRAPYGYVPVHDTRTGKLADWVADTTEAIPGLSKADVIRELFRRIKAGHAMGAIARDFKARGIVNGSGRPFVPQHLRSMVVKPAYAGIRSHHGTERPGTWKGLVSEADYRAVVRMLNTRTQAQKRRPDGRAQHDLTRIIRCGKCGGPMRAAQVKGAPCYECREHGCVRVPRARIDEFLIGTEEQPGVILAFLADESRVYEAFTAAPEDEARAEEIRTERERLEGERREAEGTKTATVGEALAMGRLVDSLSEDIARLQAEEQKLRAPAQLADMITPGKDVAKRWAAAPVAARRAVARMVLAPSVLGEVRIMPVGPGSRVDPADRAHMHKADCKGCAAA
ncbi:recombinase family protein [Streptomyces sp. NBC_00878]|uniref:recombinase family protein n=1 Tax=Streptomyces sp. NBC_00878 TaxID=2975854 RepID=UPI00224EBA65|nr:recombinase family protein [Streptomyces sp. NBC_00878]MCX4904601.1 recombinase family protein [Streptomyces sp. NBC_00878]